MNKYKITARNNDFLKEVKAKYNSKIYDTILSIINHEGEQAARDHLEYLKQRI
jgi:hypothetical protein